MQGLPTVNATRADLAEFNTVEAFSVGASDEVLVHRVVSEQDVQSESCARA